MVVHNLPELAVPPSLNRLHHHPATRHVGLARIDNERHDLKVLEIAIVTLQRSPHRHSLRSISLSPVVDDSANETTANAYGTTALAWVKLRH